MSEKKKRPGPPLFFERATRYRSNFGRQPSLGLGLQVQIDPVRFAPPLRGLARMLAEQPLVAIQELFPALFFLLKERVVPVASAANQFAEELAKDKGLRFGPRENAFGEQRLATLDQCLDRAALRDKPQAHSDPLQAKAAVEAIAQGIDDVANFQVADIELRRVTSDFTVAPNALGVRANTVPHAQAVPQGLHLLHSVWMDCEARGFDADRADEVEPKAHPLQERPISKREKAQHLEANAMDAVVDLVKIHGAKARLNV